MALLGFDSLDALRLSLTTRLGRDLPMREPAVDLEVVVGRLLLEETRTNERTIAALRVILSLLYLALALAGTTFGRADISTAGLAAIAAWTTASLLGYIALARGWYAVGFRHAAPIADAVAIAVGGVLAARGAAGVEGTHVALVANVALLCSLLVFTGTLRLTRASTRTSSTLAVLAFLIVAAVAQLSPMPTIGIVAGLLASSVLSGRVTNGIRRVIQTEVGRITMERQVERADARVAEAQAASSAREEVLRIVAHDLRNPLGTILMAADLLAESSLGTELRDRQLAIVKRTGTKMNRLLHDLLNVAQMEAGRLTMEMEPVAPAVLIANALELMQPLAAEASLELLTSVQDGLPQVQADIERIGQVFSNLIGNAIKFTPAGGRITLAAEAREGEVSFSVTDTGPGIPPEQLEKVFGPFWQAKRSDSRGIGLGLTIARGIVEAHGGTLWLERGRAIGSGLHFALITFLSHPTS